MIQLPQDYIVKKLQINTMYFIKYTSCDVYVYKAEAEFAYVLTLYKEDTPILYKEYVDYGEKEVSFRIEPEQYQSIIDKYFSEIFMEHLL